MDEQSIYDNFIKWLDKTWWKLPESEHLRPMIKANYTPEEAEFLTGIPFSSQTFDEIVTLKKMPPDDVKSRLKEMSGKGLIYESVRGDSIKYRLNDSFMAHLRANLWPGPSDERAQKTAPLINKYLLDGWFDQYNDVQYCGIRTLPIEKTIEDTRKVMPYEDVAQVIANFEYYTVSHCPCRVRHNLDPDMPDCHHPVEVCLHFDDLGRYIVENGQGREITREETFEILKQAADSGLIHALSNWQEKPDTICNCCNCCCVFLEGYHKMGHDKAHDVSNYLVEIDESTCKACGLCTKRCPMDALQLKYSTKATNKFKKSAMVNPDLCLGCGVCVHKCPTQSMKLVQKEEIQDPPKNMGEYMKHYMADRKAAIEKRKEAENS